MYGIFNALLGFSLAATNAKTIQEPHVQNANHIFNAIHSSMRQWGSSLNHNGMTFFLATVPQGTQFYHGTTKSDRINGTQWLAFEAEHALVFSRSRRGPPPGKGNPHDGPPHAHHTMQDEEHCHDDVRNDWETEEDAHHQHKGEHRLPRSRKRSLWKQRPIIDRAPLESDRAAGYLHTYRTRHNLRLLYIDGQSAAKSAKGTLDTQDLILLHDYPPPSKTADHTGPPMGESYRAEHLCDLARTEWQGRISGFLRMEMGFEIILCSFEDDLDVERITQVETREEKEPPGHRNAGDGFTYYQAVASRFDGIGGDRVSVDYESCVSMFAIENAVYFDELNLPRIRNDSHIIKPVLEEVKQIVLAEATSNTVNWQAVTDMVVARYADPVEYLSSGDLPTLNAFTSEVNRILRPFIDYSDRNATTETHRCATQFIPENYDRKHLAPSAILHVATTLCSSLQDMSAASSYTEALAIARDLRSWLAWTTWKRCRGCGYHEVCFVPIWPMGGVEEYASPRCASNMSETGRGYWGREGP